MTTKNTFRIAALSIVLLLQLGVATPAVTIDTANSKISLNTFLHFSSGITSTFRKALGLNEDVSLRNNTQSKLSILNVNFQTLGQETSDFSTQALDPNANTEAAVTVEALVYPNPFRQEDGAQLGYGLSKSMDIDIHFYDMLANRILEQNIPAGQKGARAGYNLVDIKENDFGDNVKLSAGVYFYLILNEGEVLAKGKTAVIP